MYRSGETLFLVKVCIVKVDSSNFFALLVHYSLVFVSLLKPFEQFRHLSLNRRLGAAAAYWIGTVMVLFAIWV